MSTTPVSISLVNQRLNVLSPADLPEMRISIYHPPLDSCCGVGYGEFEITHPGLSGFLTT
jgi:hypothetical protein